MSSNTLTPYQDSATCHMCPMPARWLLTKDDKHWRLCTNCGAKASHKLGIKHLTFNPDGKKDTQP